MRRSLGAVAPALGLGLVALAACLVVPARPALAQDKYEVHVSPDYIEVPGGARVEFTARLFRKGEYKTTDHHWTWKADAGHFVFGPRTSSFQNQNTWVAPHRPGTYTIQVTTTRAEREGNFGTAQVVVGHARPPEPAHRHFAKFRRDSYRVKCSERYQLELDTCGCDDMSWDWSATGGYVSDGWYTAPDQAGTFYIDGVDGTYGTRVRLTVVVECAPVVVRCSIVPDRIECGPGERLQVNAYGWDARGNQVSENCVWDWGCTGGSVGGGWYTAGDAPGTYQVWVTERNTRIRCTIEVVIRATVRLIHIAPRVVVLRPGQRVQFTFQAYDPFNRPVHAGDAVYHFDGGTMTADGWFTAGHGSGQHYRVEITHPSGASDWADVFITR